MLPELEALLGLFVALLGCLLGLQKPHRQPPYQLAGVSPNFPVEVSLHGDGLVLLGAMLEDARRVLLRPQHPILQNASRANHFIVSIYDHRYLLCGIELGVLKLEVFFA